MGGGGGRRRRERTKEVMIKLYTVQCVTMCRNTLDVDLHVCIHIYTHVHIVIALSCCRARFDGKV